MYFWMSECFHCQNLHLKFKSFCVGDVDFDQSKEQFKEIEHKNISIADVRAFLEKKSFKYWSKMMVVLTLPNVISKW